MKYFCSIFIEGNKEWSAVTKTLNHNYRLKDVKNADSTISRENIVYYGNNPEIIFQELKDSVTYKPHSRTLLLICLVLTVSQDYFRSSLNKEQFDEKVNAFGTRAAEWARERFGDRLKSAVMHLDEQKPHMHVLVQPMDTDGRLRSSSVLPGRHCYQELRKSFSEAMEPLGFSKDKKVKNKIKSVLVDYYPTILESIESLPLYDFSEDARELLRNDPIRVKGAQNLEESLKNHINVILEQKFKEFESSFLKNYELRRTLNSSLYELASLSKELEKEYESHKRLSVLVMTVNIQKLLSDLSGIPINGEFSEEQLFRLPNGLNIKSFKTGWEDTDNREAFGTEAISLYSYIKGYEGENSMFRAARELSLKYPIKRVTTTFNKCLAISNNKTIVKKALASEWKGPSLSEESFLAVRKILIEDYGLKPRFVDYHHSSGVLGADRLGNLILSSKRLGKGEEEDEKTSFNYYRVWWDEEAYDRFGFVDLNYQKEPFYLEGAGEALALSLNPFQALCVRERRNGFGVLAFPEDHLKERFQAAKELFRDKDIYLPRTDRKIVSLIIENLFMALPELNGDRLRFLPRDRFSPESERAGSPSPDSIKVGS
jgi:hypothetical protein